MEKLLFEVSKDMNISKQFNNVDFTNEGICFYNFETKTISIDEETILDYSNIKVPTKDEKMIKCFQNSRIVYHLIHEIMHAKQVKKMEDDENDLKSILYSISYERIAKNLHLYNDKNHDTFLIEYDANVRGYLKTIEFLLSIDNDLPIDIMPLINYIMEGYKGKISPLEIGRASCRERVCQ